MHFSDFNDRKCGGWGGEEGLFSQVLNCIMHFGCYQLFNDYYVFVAIPSNVWMRSDWLLEYLHNVVLLFPFHR